MGGTPVVEARWTAHASPRVLCFALAAAMGCGSSDRAPPVGSAGSSSTGAGGTGRIPAGGQGGAGGSDTTTPPLGGEGGSGATPIDAGADADATDAGDGAGAGGAGGVAGAGGAAGSEGAAGAADAGDGVDADVPGNEDPPDAGSEEEVPAEWSCDGDYAYGASDTLVFSDPTPAALASALSEINGTGHPISLVLQLEDDALSGALSATTANGSGQQIFLPHSLTLAPAVAAFGTPPGVTTDDPQPSARLRFEDEDGPVDVLIEHVVWRATQDSLSCDTLTVSLQAVIPSSQLSVVLHLSSGDQTIGELSSGSSPPIGPPPPPTPVEIAATFEGALVDFDFASL